MLGIREIHPVNIQSLMGCVLFQYVVTPRRQSTAIALQILVSHLLGDAGSPYLIGIVSEFPAYCAFLMVTLIQTGRQMHTEL